MDGYAPFRMKYVIQQETILISVKGMFATLTFELKVMVVK